MTMQIISCKWSSASHVAVLVNGDTIVQWPSANWIGAAVQAWVDSGNTIAPADAETLAGVKSAKLAEIDAAYASALKAGFTSSTLGAPHRYASDLGSQVKLAGAAISALAGDAVQYECTEVSTGTTAPRAHTATQMKQALIDGKNRAVAYKLHQTDLRNQVAAIVVDGTTTEAIAIALVQAITPAFVE